MIDADLKKAGEICLCEALIVRALFLRRWHIRRVFVGEGKNIYGRIRW